MRKLIKQSWIIKNKEGKECEVSFNVIENEVEFILNWSGERLEFDSHETKELKKIFEDTNYIFDTKNLKQ
jgi:hypothetical protein